MDIKAECSHCLRRDDRLLSPSMQTVPTPGLDQQRESHLDTSGPSEPTTHLFAQARSHLKKRARSDSDIVESSRKTRRLSTPVCHPEALPSVGVWPRVQDEPVLPPFSSQSSTGLAAVSIPHLTSHIHDHGHQADDAREGVPKAIADIQATSPVAFTLHQWLSAIRGRRHEDNDKITS